MATLAREPVDLVFVLDVAHEDVASPTSLDLLAALFAAHDVDDFGPGLAQHAADVPGHALAIGDAHDEDASCRQVGGNLAFVFVRR